MSKIKFILGAGIAAATMFATTANATITTFAQFSAINSSRNIRWLNNGPGSLAASNTATGTGGRFYTTSNGSATAPGVAKVNFQFLQPVLSSLGILSANFFMDTTVVTTAATGTAPSVNQRVPTGGFSFTSTAPITLGSMTFAAGSNLLTSVYTNATIFGSSTSGSFTGNSQTASLVYSSDFLNFSNTVNRDFSMSITSITPPLFRSLAGSGRALRTFRGLAGGSFASDPAPIVNGVPEPQVWGLLVVGFGMVGVQVRRRARQSAITA